MVALSTLRPPRLPARRGRWITGMGAMLAACLLVGGLSPSLAQAQKNINFTTTGSVRSTLVFTNQISPDVYSFFAVAGEPIRVQTSDNSFDTTLRVIGPDAAINLFDDDGGSVAGSFLASRLVFTTADTGTYLVVVSSFSGNPGGGDYTLTLARGAAAAAIHQAVSVDRQAGESQSDVENPVEEKPHK